MEITGLEDTLKSPEIESNDGNKKVGNNLYSTTPSSLFNVLTGNQNTKKNTSTSKIRKDKDQLYGGDEKVVNGTTEKLENRPTSLTSKDIFRIYREKDKQKYTPDDQEPPVHHQPTRHIKLFPRI